MPLSSEDIEINDTSAKKSRQPRERRVSKIDTHSSVDSIMDQLLSQHVALPISSVLVMITSVHNMLVDKVKTRCVRLDDDDFAVNQASLSGLPKSQAEYFADPAGRIDCEIINAGKVVRVRALVDFGSQINVIEPEIKESLGLVPHVDEADNITGADGTAKPLKGICESVVLNVAGVSHRVDAFVPPSTNEDLILRVPWLRQMSASIDFIPSGMVMLYLKYDGRVIQAPIMAPDDKNWHKRVSTASSQPVTFKVHSRSGISNLEVRRNLRDIFSDF